MARLYFLCFSVGLFLAGVSMAAAVQSDRGTTPSEHEITDLPGINHTQLGFKMFSGYITVNESHGRNLFYWFVESQRDPSSDPLVIWLNGGPGCSSLIGFLSENGPFWVDKGGDFLSVSPYSWNRVANVLYIESPSGVGFAFSQTLSDYNTGDKQTADDSVIFLLRFLEQYPAYADHDVFIAGESYGGHYVPNFAKGIVEHNQKASVKINLRGFLAGNAWTDAGYDNEGAVFDWYSHALISLPTYEGVMKNCDFHNIGPLFVHTDACDQYLSQAHAEMGSIDIYDIYANICLASSGIVGEGEQLLNLLSDAPTPFWRVAALLAQSRQPVPSFGGGTDPCIGNYVIKYLNREDVQKAIHVKDIPYKWTECAGSVVHYSYEDVLRSMLPVYEYLVKQEPQEAIRMLVYSGDVDGIVPVTGTRFWLDYLEKEGIISMQQQWKPYAVENQVGGYVTHYNQNVTLATVRGAGHFVPGLQPARGFYMFSHFLDGTL